MRAFLLHAEHSIGDGDRDGGGGESNLAQVIFVIMV